MFMYRLQYSHIQSAHGIIVQYPPHGYPFPRTASHAVQDHSQFCSWCVPPLRPFADLLAACHHPHPHPFITHYTQLVTSSPPRTFPQHTANAIPPSRPFLLPIINDTDLSAAKLCVKISSTDTTSNGCQHVLSYPCYPLGRSTCSSGSATWHRQWHRPLQAERVRCLRRSTLVAAAFAGETAVTLAKHVASGERTVGNSFTPSSFPLAFLVEL